MRIAVVSDIHGNRAAFEAVLADLRETSPDCVLHGGDLADAGSSPADVVDRIRDLGWPGVMGNTDEMLVDPASLEVFARQAPQLRDLFARVAEMARATREALGAERLAWLAALPRSLAVGPMALVHATPASAWRAPAADASDEDLRTVYGPLERPIAVHGHTHRPFIRTVGGMVVVNAGSVGLPYDGDRRAAYFLLDGSAPVIRRVEYELDEELRNLACCGLPHAGWVTRILEAGALVMP